MNIRRLLLTATAATVLAGGVVVGAQDDTPISPDVETAVEQTDGTRPFVFRDRMRARDVDFDRAELFELAQSYTGLTTDEIRTSMQEGATLGELIVANGETVEDFVAEAAVPIYERIDEAVVDEVLTDERAEEMRARVTERLTIFVENANPTRRDGPRRGAMERFDGELVEQYTGLTPIDAGEQLRDGATMAELIEANGESVDDFIAEAVTELEAAIDERAAAAKENLEANVTAAVNGERPEDGFFARGGPRGGRGR